MALIYELGGISNSNNNNNNSKENYSEKALNKGKEIMSAQ